MNEVVKAKLTRYGVSRYKQHWSDVYAVAGSPRRIETKETDENGYTEFLLWELMNIFGDTMYMGNTNQAFEKNEIVWVSE